MPIRRYCQGHKGSSFVAEQIDGKSTCQFLKTLLGTHMGTFTLRPLVHCSEKGWDALRWLNNPLLRFTHSQNLHLCTKGKCSLWFTLILISIYWLVALRYDCGIDPILSTLIQGNDVNILSILPIFRKRNHGTKRIKRSEWQPGCRSLSVCLHSILLPLVAYPNNTMNHGDDNDDDDNCSTVYWS